MQAESETPQSTVDVFVMSLGSKAGLLKERLEVCSRLWDAGVKVGKHTMRTKKEPR